jgi:hypothetical protein
VAVPPSLPPRRTHGPWPASTAGVIPRTAARLAPKCLGRAIWRERTGRPRRTGAETKTHGASLPAQGFMAVRHRPRPGSGSMPRLRAPGRRPPAPRRRPEGPDRAPETGQTRTPGTPRMACLLPADRQRATAARRGGAAGRD